MRNEINHHYFSISEGRRREEGMDDIDKLRYCDFCTIKFLRHLCRYIAILFTGHCFFVRFDLNPPSSQFYYFTTVTSRDIRIL